MFSTMQRSKFYVIGIVLLSGSLISCVGPERPEPPANLIPEDHYIDLLIDMQHIKTWRNVKPDSINADSLKGLIYDRYDITEDHFLSSHTYYQKQVEQQVVRIEEVIRRLEAERDYIQAHIDSLKSVQNEQDSLSVIDE